MQQYEVRLEEAYLAELGGLIDWRAENVGRLSASNFNKSVTDLVMMLRDTPFMGFSAKNKKLARKGYRTLVCGVYLIFYIVNDSTVNVRRIVDGRTDYINKGEW